MEKDNRKILFYITFGICLFAVVNHIGVVFGFIGTVFDLLMPLIIALIVAFVLNAPMSGIENRFKRLCEGKGWAVKDKHLASLSLLLTLLSIGIIIYLVIVLVVPQVVESVTSLYHTIAKGLPSWVDFLEEHGIDAKFLEDRFNKLDKEYIIKKFGSGATAVIPAVWDFASGAIGGLVNCIFAFIIAIYVLLDKKTLKRQCNKLIKAYVRPDIGSYVIYVSNTVNTVFSKFILGQCIEACILGTMLFVAFFVSGLPFASLIAVLTAVLSLIPYIGALISCLICVLLTVMIDPWKGLMAFLLFQAVQFVEGQFIYPRVVGNSVGLSPLLTLVAAIIGGSIFGIFGMIFFIPITAVIYILVKERCNKKLDVISNK